MTVVKTKKRHQGKWGW